GGAGGAVASGYKRSRGAARDLRGAARGGGGRARGGVRLQQHRVGESSPRGSARSPSSRQLTKIRARVIPGCRDVVATHTRSRPFALPAWPQVLPLLPPVPIGR